MYAAPSGTPNSGARLVIVTVTASSNRASTVQNKTNVRGQGGGRRCTKARIGSRQRHMIGNVRVTGMDGGVAEVTCNFVTWRAKRGVVDTYYGKHRYRIDCTCRPWKIKAKRSILDMDMLYPGKLTIIV